MAFDLARLSLVTFFSHKESNPPEEQGNSLDNDPNTLYIIDERRWTTTDPI